MGKTVKNLLIIFTLVCMIMLVVFTVQLIRLNRNSDEGRGNGQSVSEGRPAETDATADEPTNSPEDGGNSTDAPPESTHSNPPPVPVGRRYEMPVSIDKLLVIYAQEELFEYEQMDSGDIFTYADGGNASLEVCLAYIPMGAEASAENYLDGYLDGNDSFVSGTGPIKRSPLSGVLVTGVKDGETFEAWIHTLEDNADDMGVAFIIRYSNDEQKNALYAILDTINII